MPCLQQAWLRPGTARRGWWPHLGLVVGAQSVVVAVGHGSEEHSQARDGELFVGLPLSVGIHGCCIIFAAGESATKQSAPNQIRD